MQYTKKTWTKYILDVPFLDGILMQLLEEILMDNLDIVSSEKFEHLLAIAF